MTLKIGISGKRYVSQDDHARLREELTRQIRQTLHEHQTSAFMGFSSLASGSDSIFADLVINEFKQPLTLVLPFPEDAYRSDFSDADWHTYGRLKPDNLILLTESTPQSKEEREQGYLEAGQYICHQVNKILIVSDGLRPNGKGGTAEIMGYIDQHLPDLSVSITEISPRKADELLLHIRGEFSKSNNVALINRDKHKRTWKNSLFMGWLAVTLFSIKTSFDLNELTQWLLAATEFVLVTATMITVYFANHRHYHHHYLTQRIRAEQLRLLETYHQAGKLVTIPFITHEEDSQLKSIIDSVNADTETMPYQSKWYSASQITTLIQAQINYHTRKITQIGGKRIVLDRVNLAIGILFFVNILVSFILETFEHCHAHPPFELPKGLGVCLSIALPALYAAIEGFLHFEDWEAIEKHSRFARENLEKTLKELLSANGESDENKCHHQYQDVLNKAAIIMLDDNRKWHLVLEEKAHYHWV